MDEKFRKMLLESEKIRARCRSTRNIGPHARQMTKMIGYAQEKKLFIGSVLARNANEELLNHTVEIAACSLEIIHGEEIGPVIALSSEKKMEIILRAKAKAEQAVALAKKHGLL